MLDVNLADKLLERDIRGDEMSIENYLCVLTFLYKGFDARVVQFSLVSVKLVAARKSQCSRKPTSSRTSFAGYLSNQHGGDDEKGKG